MSSATAFTLLEIVLRDTSNPHEAENAKRQLARLVGKAGSAPKLFGAGSSSPLPPPMSFNESRRAMSELEGRVENLAIDKRALEARVSKLVLENGKLKEELDSVKVAMVGEAASTDGSMSYRDFSHKVEAITGMKQWVREFLNQTGMDEKILIRARVAGRVSADIVKLLADIRPARKAMFSPEQVAFIRKLAVRNFSETKIAEETSERFGAFYTPEHIRKLKVDLINGRGVYSDPAYKGPLPRAHRTVLTTKANESRENILEAIRAAGKKGMHKVALRAVEPDNQRRSVRTLQLIRANEVFRVGEDHLVSIEFKDAYPEDLKAHIEELADWQIDNVMTKRRGNSRWDDPDKIAQFVEVLSDPKRPSYEVIADRLSKLWNVPMTKNVIKGLAVRLRSKGLLKD
jgi:hypothetical protein